MGIEAAVLTPILLGAAGAAASAALAPKPSKPAAPPTPEKPPQQTKAPEMPAFRRQNVAVEGAGVNNTLLTGPQGVTNDLLNLGRNTLLGA